MLDLNDLLYFAEVVDKGGFAAASRSLGVPKSKISRRVAQLEARLGVRLLQRTTRSLSLTEAGESCHVHCVAMREQVEAAEEAVARVRSEPRGNLRVACPVTLAQTTLAPLLPAFMTAHPQVRIELRVTNRVIDLVQEAVDVALRVRPELDDDSSSLVARRLGRTHAVLVAGQPLLQRTGPIASTADLARLPSLAMSAVNGRSTWRLIGPHGEDFELHHQPVCAADDLHVLKAAALSGTGMTILPESLCHAELQQGLLAPVLPGWAPPVANVLAVFPSRRGMVPAVRRFLDFLAERLAGDRIEPADAAR